MKKLYLFLLLLSVALILTACDNPEPPEQMPQETTAVTTYVTTSPSTTPPVTTTVTEPPETRPLPLYESAQQVENMTEEQLRAHALQVINGEGFVIAPDFYNLDDFGVEFISFDVVFDDSPEPEQWRERWMWVFHTSTDCREQAHELASQEIWSEDLISADYIGENDYYFSFRVKWTHPSFNGNDAIFRTLVFKSSAMYASGIHHNVDYGGYYEIVSRDIQNPDKQTVKDLLDIHAFFFRHHDYPQGWTIIYTDVTETDTEFIYTIYTVDVTDDFQTEYIKAGLSRNRHAVNKSTGRHNFSPDGHADGWYNSLSYEMIKTIEFTQ